MYKIVYVKPIRVFSLTQDGSNEDIHEIRLNELENMPESKWKELGRKYLLNGNRLIGCFVSNDLAAIAVMSGNELSQVKEMPKYMGKGLKEKLTEYCM